jgi:hypothetical protein
MTSEASINVALMDKKVFKVALHFRGIHQPPAFDVTDTPEQKTITNNINGLLRITLSTLSTDQKLKINLQEYDFPHIFVILHIKR